MVVDACGMAAMRYMTPVWMMRSVRPDGRVSEQASQLMVIAESPVFLIMTCIPLIALLLPENTASTWSETDPGFFCQWLVIPRPSTDIAQHATTVSSRHIHSGLSL